MKTYSNIFTKKIDLSFLDSMNVDLLNFLSDTYKIKIINKNNQDFSYLFTSVLNLATEINKNLQINDVRCGSFYADSRPCNEDCSFCPLSKYHYNKINITSNNKDWYELPENILDFAIKMKESKVSHFKIVTTGAKTDTQVIPFIAEGVRKAKYVFPESNICISEGILDESSLKHLKEAGVDIFNNNLESSKRIYSSIVTTHSYEQKIESIKLAKKIGFKICSGAIYGIGENLIDRFEIFNTLRNLGVYSSPFNFFVQFSNLPLTKLLQENNFIFNKYEYIFSIALFRLIYPEVRIVLGAGRRDRFTDEDQELLLNIGASALASSGYFSKEGVIDSVKSDNKILKNICR